MIRLPVHLAFFLSPFAKKLTFGRDDSAVIGHVNPRSSSIPTLVRLSRGQSGGIIGREIVVFHRAFDSRRLNIKQVLPKVSAALKACVLAADA